MTDSTDVAVVGAGPYGLSIAAHLRAAGVRVRIFGRPMQTWREHMPDGMLLKSDGFASNLADPDGVFTLARFCASTGVPYHDTRRPVAIETFRAYGLAFQQRMVPEVEDKLVTAIEREAFGFRIALDEGGSVTARRVILAVGITHFAVLPSPLKGLPGDLVSHSSAHVDVRGFRGRDVAVVGAGASALDLAVLLAEAGARVVLIARRDVVRFHDPPAAHRSLWTRLRFPTTTIGAGWPSLFYTKAPGLFYRLPTPVRRRLVNASHGPAAGWPMKARFAGNVRTLLGYEVAHADAHEGRVRLTLTGHRGTTTHVADHVIAATGYEADVRRLTFLGPGLRAAIRTIHRAPLLSSSFEASVPGLYIVGYASKYCFGPAMQFACGAEWTARRIRRRLAGGQARRRSPLAATPDDMVVR